MTPDGGGPLRPKLIHVVGARPNFVKAGPVLAECARRGIEQLVVHTGQHYDDAMSSIFFRELGLPSPDVNLEVGSGSHAEQTAQVMVRLEPIIVQQRPDWVVVYGDVNSTIAAALVCAKLGTSLAHVEAGLRSFDRTMPEEVNRVVTDQLADLLLTPSADANENLAREGVDPRRVRLVGNVMIDTLVSCLPAARERAAAAQRDRYALVTLHRPSNVDDDVTLGRLMEAILRVSRRLPVIFPVHPRTRQRLERLPIGATVRAASNVELSEPLGYLDFLGLEEAASAVITDSGGIQEETTFLGVPCFTLRENTERPVTVSLGSNTLIGYDYARLERELDSLLDRGPRRSQVPPLWDGRTAGRIADALLETMPVERQPLD
jgi:UDP-N-acetylglucosamine 2-epimerase (non-hydrolysing)